MGNQLKRVGDKRRLLLEESQNNGKVYRSQGCSGNIRNRNWGEETIRLGCLCSGFILSSWRDSLCLCEAEDHQQPQTHIFLPLWLDRTLRMCYPFKSNWPTDLMCITENFSWRKKGKLFNGSRILTTFWRDTVLAWVINGHHGTLKKTTVKVYHVLLPLSQYDLHLLPDLCIHLNNYFAIINWQVFGTSTYSVKIMRF